MVCACIVDEYKAKQRHDEGGTKKQENTVNPAIIFSLAVFENIDFTIANSAGERPSEECKDKKGKHLKLALW